MSVGYRWAAKSRMCYLEEVSVVDIELFQSLASSCIKLTIAVSNSDVAAFTALAVSPNAERGPLPARQRDCLDYRCRERAQQQQDKRREEQHRERRRWPQHLCDCDLCEAVVTSEPAPAPPNRDEASAAPRSISCKPLPPFDLH